MTTDFKTFDVTRHINKPSNLLWRCWTDPDLKRRWFAEGHDAGLTTERYDLDFEGGTEIAIFRHSAYGQITYHAQIQQAVPDSRLIYSYTMKAGDTLLSVSLATTTFTPEGDGTTLLYTEQAVFLDGGDWMESRYAGTVDLLDRFVTLAKDTQ